MDISVIICTYNGAAQLPVVFERLLHQAVDTNVEWEIVVVDNNSRDRTASVVQGYQRRSAFRGRLRYQYEPQQGIAYARRCGTKVAKGELLAFLDDDNLPQLNWLQAVYDFGRQHPLAGAYGGQIVGRYEAEPPENFSRIACFLAVIDRGDRPFRYDQLRRWLFPAGAGVIIRRSAWQSVPASPTLAGVSGGSLNAKGEDIEMLSHIRRRGWQIWHSPTLRIEHVIGRDRISAPYLLKLFRGVGLSRYRTRSLQYRGWQLPAVVVAYGVKDLVKLLLYYLGHRHTLRSDLVAQCEITLLYNSLVSPLFCLVKEGQNRFDWLKPSRNPRLDVP
ncbi:MAG: hormogonium polysaccharide biosynthesis glycosyltransferase HpsE [Cyanobacteria bacterium J06632_22]